jgi:hypothetical protein
MLARLHSVCMFEPKPDIQGRAEIETLVNTFYSKIKAVS